MSTNNRKNRAAAQRRKDRRNKATRAASTAPVAVAAKARPTSAHVVTGAREDVKKTTELSGIRTNRLSCNCTTERIFELGRGTAQLVMPDAVCTEHGRGAILFRDCLLKTAA